MSTFDLSQKLGKQFVLGLGDRSLDSNVDEKKKRLRKFKESAWKCIYFLSAEVFALTVTYDEPWFKNTRFFWIGPGEQVWPDQKLK